MNGSRVLLLGAGYMAKEYAKVLSELNVDYDVITRSRETADAFEKEIDKKVYACDLVKFLDEHDGYSHAINAFKAEALQDSNIKLMKFGIKDILSEKPGAWDCKGLRILSEKAKKTGTRLFLAYNRRYYQSVIRAQELIAEDGGLKNIDFEFTEWADRLGVSEWNRSIVEKVLVGNSTHVIDLAWYFAGRPSEYVFYSDYNRADDKLQGIFVGSGVTDREVYFSYKANWSSPGRWGVELVTSKHRLYLRPLEKLFVQKLNSIEIEPYELNDEIDVQFKPGIFLQTKAFLEGQKDSRLKTIEDQVKDIEIVERMKKGSNDE